MTKKMKLTVPGNQGFHPQIGADDLVTKGGSPEDSQSVTDWLLSKLADIHARCSQIINDHLTEIGKPPEFGGSS